MFLCLISESNDTPMAIYDAGKDMGKVYQNLLACKLQCLKSAPEIES